MVRLKLGIWTLACALMALTACGTLHSNTFIPPQERFELGNNPHKGFKVTVKNASAQPVTLYQAPISGGTHSPMNVLPGQKARIKVDKNTAMCFKNTSNDTCSIFLVVKGDLGLSMGYQPQK